MAQFRLVAVLDADVCSVITKKCGEIIQCNQGVSDVTVGHHDCST